MPAVLSYPGVYIEELPSGVRTITGVSTSITAFIGSAMHGPVNDPVRVQSFAEFERTFGGLWMNSTLGYAVFQFFQNGGGDALIVRVTAPSVAGVKAKATVTTLKLVAASSGTQGNTLKATIADATSGTATLFKLTIDNPPNSAVVFDEVAYATVGTTLASAIVRLDPTAPALTVRPANGGPVQFAGGVDSSGPPAATGTVGGTAGLAMTAANPGMWGNKLEVAVLNLGTSAVTAANGGTFNLSVKDTATGATEQFLNLSLDSSNARFATKVLEQGSSLVRVSGAISSTTSVSSTTAVVALTGGADGGVLTDTDVLGSQSGKTGLYALEKADLFNLLCIPPLTPTSDIAFATRDAAAKYCHDRRALFIADPDSGWTTHALAIAGLGAHMSSTENAALFFPKLRVPDPLREGQIGDFAPCGAVAGVMARTDATRGVWKAPAGIDATLNGVVDLSVKLTDGENGQLNPLGVNCLRSFPVIGRVVWGSRTMKGADQLADQWKYIPVRRLALFLEESLFRGTQWVVFEPNDEPLWAQIRLNIGAFMHNLFRQGAFQGMTPKDAYFVKCDKDTTTQNDINLGIVNIVVGFAPLKPAEFVVIKIQQIAGQVES